MTNKASLEVLLRSAYTAGNARQGCGAAESVASEGWAEGNTYSASPARKIVENDNDRLDRCLLSGALCPYPTIRRLWVARSSVGSRVARRLPGRHSSVAASRCAAGLDFLWGSVDSCVTCLIPGGDIQPLWEQLVNTAGHKEQCTKLMLALNAEMLSHEALRKIQPHRDQHSHP